MKVLSSPVWPAAKMFLAAGMMACLVTSGFAEPLKLKWEALRGAGYSGQLRQTVARFAGIGPLWVSVYLPAGYSQSIKYPVLYVLDGQNLFDGKAGTWELDETLEELSQAGKMKKILVVGIHTGVLAEPGNHGFDRMKWFVPKETFSVDEKAWQGGGASQFLGLVLQLKDKIDHDFSTNPKDVGIMGSSLGGVFSEYAGFKRSDVFQHVAILSPSAWLHKRKQQGTEDWHPAHAPWPKYIWMDMGTHEGDAFNKGAWHEHPADSARYSKATGEEAIWIDKQPETKFIHFRYTPYDPVPGHPEHLPARHNEPSWAMRVREALPFLYPPGK